jgi:cell division protein ZapA
MAQVSVNINGRQYRMACDDGQENHLARLAHELDRRITRLRTDFGEIGDMRLTVMAALILADELTEQGHRLRQVEEELKVAQDARMIAADRAKKTEVAIVNAFNSAAERIERIARSLNHGPSGHGMNGDDVARG